MNHSAASPRLAGAGPAALARARDGLAETRRSWRVLLQATVAASLAYALAEAIGHETPFFAPIAAIATVAISLAHRLRRAAELLVGNALGILFADLLIARIGTGAWQVGLVVALALAAALVAGGGPILIMQSSSAAILIATLTPPTAAEPFNTARFVDALIGGGVGLVVSALLMPGDPARHAREASDPLLSALADGYRRVARALRQRDSAAAEAVLADLRATSPVLDSLRSGLDTTRETIRLAPWYWGQRTLLASYALAGFHLDNALRNLRVLARQSAVALDRGESAPDVISEGLVDLATAASGLSAVLAGKADPAGARDALLRAVAISARAPEATDEGEPGLFTAPLVAQIRLSASDLLQATGMSTAEAAAAIRATADPHP